MSEETIPDVNITSDVEVKVENYSEKTLAELVDLFAALGEGAERVKRSKEAEAIKSAFYKLLAKEKAAAGLSAEVVEPAEDTVETETAAVPSEEVVNPFEAIEAGFKALYVQFKKERAEVNRQTEQEREENLVKKQAVIEDLKALVEKQEDVNATFPAFREIQNRWREIGQVPATNATDINKTYQFFVEKFYDMVKINHDLRDLDFKKNLEAKEALCAEAETLSQSEDLLGSFRELQKLHEQWKELGPVAREVRESVWERFKAATAVINKNYQTFYEEQKSKFADNLAKKEELCVRVEQMLESEITTSNEWNSLTKQIEEIQKEWKTVGFASKKDNQKVYDRFRAACDSFFEKKRAFYGSFKDEMTVNLDKKMALIEKAEALKVSTDWKKTTDQFISMQKEWKEIGAVPRKKSEALWKRFRAACDEFFAERDKQAKPENNFYMNLKAKKALVEEIKAYKSAGEVEADRQAMKEFEQKWNAIGFVPFKEKDAMNEAYKKAVKAAFPDFQGRGRSVDNRNRAAKAPKSEREVLIQKYHALQQDIDTYENNIGFFSLSKNSQPLIAQMQERIAAAKNDLKELEARIKAIEDAAAPKE